MRRLGFLILLLLSTSLFGGETITLTIMGMTCPFCAGAVERQLQALPEVEKVKISLSQSKADVILKDGKTVDRAVLEKAVIQAGFSVEKADGK